MNFFGLANTVNAFESEYVETFMNQEESFLVRTFIV